jgi:hypothetical protein
MTTVRIGWGLRITLLYLGFVAIIITLVAGSMHQDFDLVSADYYERELTYQQVLDAAENQNTLSAPVSVFANASMLTIVFPPEFSGKQVEGKVHFYSPVNAAWDKEMPITVIDGKMSVDRSMLEKTRYNVKIDWTVDGKEYYQQSEISLHQ